MNTPAHILIGSAAFGQGGGRRVLAAAALGGLAPDASLYFLAGGSIFVLGIPPQTVFDQLYFSDAWQAVFAVDNSVFVWGALLLAALVWRLQALIAFAGSGLLHLALDFPLHAGDGRAHFWPVSDWVYHSPVSYWDSHYHAAAVAPISVALCVGAYVSLWPGLRWPGRLIFALLLAAELWVARQWLLFF